MKAFLQREIREAYAHAAAGGQALHICDSAGLVTSAAPGCFQRSEQFAHLFDQNYERLIATAKRCGVRVIRPQYCGTHRQHIDLCGGPLNKAIKHANGLLRREKEKAGAGELELAQSLLPLDLGKMMEGAK